MPTTLALKTQRLMTDPRWGSEMAAFCDSLIAQHYVPMVIEVHARHLSRALPRLHGSHHTAEDLRRAFRIPDKSLRKHRYLTAAAGLYGRFLEGQGRLRPTPDRGRFARLRRDYAHFLLEMRGLSQSSRDHNAAVVKDFVDRALDPGQSIRSLTADQVERFVMLRSREISRHSLQHDVAYVRAFLRYCHDCGYVSRPFVIERPRTYRGELPPRAMPWESVQKLLTSIDQTQTCGKRDYTILHLMAHYGLRPSEIIALKLDSIDWDRRLLSVTQPKTSSKLVLPLAQPTLRVLRSYLAHGRRDVGFEHEALFLCEPSPPGPMKRYAIGDLFERHARAAGLTGVGHHVYRLRHSFAMRLLARGVGVKAIGDVLGHRSMDTTCTYLRLDTDVLRNVALEVPGAVSGQEAGHA